MFFSSKLTPTLQSVFLEDFWCSSSEFITQAKKKCASIGHLKDEKKSTLLVQCRQLVIHPSGNPARDTFGERVMTHHFRNPTLGNLIRIKLLQTS